MGDFSEQLRFEKTGEVISPLSEQCWAKDSIVPIGQVFAGAVWPVANKAFFLPFTLNESVTVYKLGWGNGNPVAGNLDAGIYDFRGNLIISTGSTAQAGAPAHQIVDIADTGLVPGHYFLALSKDTTGTGIINRTTPQLQLMEAVGMLEMVAAFPLPSTVTFAIPSSSYLPLVVAHLTPTT